MAGSRFEAGAVTPFGSAEVEDDAGLHMSLLDFFEAVVHVIKRAGLVDHPGAALTWMA